VPGVRVETVFSRDQRGLENLLQRMKVFRRVATRYDKLDITFLDFAHIADTIKWRH
jgi:hypothetical protein